MNLATSGISQQRVEHKDVDGNTTSTKRADLAKTDTADTAGTQPKIIICPVEPDDGDNGDPGRLGTRGAKKSGLEGDEEEQLEFWASETEMRVAGSTGR